MKAISVSGLSTVCCWDVVWRIVHWRAPLAAPCLEPWEENGACLQPEIYAQRHRYAQQEPAGTPHVDAVRQQVRQEHTSHTLPALVAVRGARYIVAFC